MNLNANQVIAIILAVLGVFVASTAQLTDLFGASHAHLIVSVSSLLMSIMSSVLAILTGQAGMVRAVTAMPGVDKLVVNTLANQTLAQIACDPTSQKVEAAPGAAPTVQKIAAGG